LSAPDNQKTEEQSSDELWTSHKEVYVETAVSVVGYTRGTPRERWILDKHGKQSMNGKNIKK